MTGLPGRVTASAKGRVQVELTNSGQLIALDTNVPFFIGDPVVVASEGGKITGLTRASKKMVRSTSEYGEGLGPYWQRGK